MDAGTSIKRDKTDSPRLGQRQPPKAVRFLLPVWGSRYIEQFLKLGLPALLAPGNVPAVAAALPSEFVFLTSSRDGELLLAHPAIQFLGRFCKVSIKPIDDLIVGDNHSTTITLAYARAVRELGGDMLDTCFFFLIADYIIADGSLKNVLDRICRGASGVQAGNFQVVDSAYENFCSAFGADREATLSLAPRALVKWSLNFLHPISVANIANFPFSRTNHPNRLFWQVDRNTLVGRFYLMHMICIRPEVADFVVGSSCDYSFIPELCPSGNVEAMTDSDDYLVVEMQPFNHESRLIEPGGFTPKQIANSLSEWTTERHRQNSAYQLVFHAAGIPPSLADLNGKIESFIGEVNANLSAKPQPWRNHPYWVAALDAHRRTVERKKLTLSPDVAQDSKKAASGFGWFIVSLRNVLFGSLPNVRLAHPRWADYRMIYEESEKALGGKPRLAVVSTEPSDFVDWISDLAPDVVGIKRSQIASLSVSARPESERGFDGIFFLLDSAELSDIREYIDRLSALLAPGGVVAIAIVNGYGIKFSYDFAMSLSRFSSRFVTGDFHVRSAQVLPAGLSRFLLLKLMVSLEAAIRRNPALYLPVGVVMGPVLYGIGMIANALTIVSKREDYNNLSSAFIVLDDFSGSSVQPQKRPVDEFAAKRARQFEILLTQPASKTEQA